MSRVNFHTTQMNELDLDLNNYSLHDLLHLFGIEDLTEASLRQAKQVTQKIHPDKSRLNMKYFVFFSQAFERLKGVYEFQNKAPKGSRNTNTTYSPDIEAAQEDQTHTLNHMFESKKELKDSRNFNQWFNESFEKHGTTADRNNTGYGDWLKGNEGILDTSGQNVTKGNMNELFERQKKQMQTVTVYQGVTDLTANMFSGSLLDSDKESFTTEHFTDLRQAFTETLIPVTEEDYQRMPKFKSVSEYQRHRDQVDLKPETKQESERKLLRQQEEANQHSMALAYKFAQESAKVEQSKRGFWGEIRQIAGL